MKSERKSEYLRLEKKQIVRRIAVLMALADDDGMTSDEVGFMMNLTAEMPQSGFDKVFLALVSVGAIGDIK